MTKTVRVLCTIDITYLVADTRAYGKTLEWISLLARKTGVEHRIDIVGESHMLMISSPGAVSPIKKEVEHLLPLLHKHHRDHERRVAESDARMERRARIPHWRGRPLPQPIWTSEAETDLMHERAAIAKAAAPAKIARQVRQARGAAGVHLVQ
jgi:hypothetical protein